MKKLSIIALLASLGFSATTIMPYGSYIDYSSKALKDKAYLGGVYGSFYKAPYKVEVDGEYLKIKYKKEYNIPDWKQKDLTLIGHYYIGNNYDVKLGIHNIFVDDGTDSYYQKTLIGGILYHEYMKYNVGLDYYYTPYHGGFNVKQLTPKFGFNFGNYDSQIGSFYAEGKVNFIKISDANQAPKDNYTNVDLKLQNFKGAWTTTLEASIGKFAYKVGNDGFVVYNIGDEYKYTTGIKINYSLSKTDNISAGYTLSRYDNGTDTPTSNTFLISYVHSF